jgi:hypothetical protein
MRPQGFGQQVDGVRAAALRAAHRQNLGAEHQDVAAFQAGRGLDLVPGSTSLAPLAWNPFD